MASDALTEVQPLLLGALTVHPPILAGRPAVATARATTRPSWDGPPMQECREGVGVARHPGVGNELRRLYWPDEPDGQPGSIGTSSSVARQAAKSVSSENAGQLEDESV